MNYNELVSEVLSIVKRPDQMPRIESAVRAATLKAHRQDYFFRDLKESGVTFTDAEYIQNFLPTQIFGARFRKIKYIRLWNYDISDAEHYGRAGVFLDAIDIENAIDQYGYTKHNVYYMAGELVQIRCASALSHCIVGAYVNPLVATPETFDSWIAEQQPYAIVYEAARQLFNQIGKASDASTMTTAVAEEFAQLKLDSVNKPGE